MPNATWTRVKIKVETTEKRYEREDETDWCAAKEKLPLGYKLASELISGVLTQILESPYGLPPPDIESINWSLYNGLTGKYMKGGRYTELKEGDPPVAFMTNLTRIVDQTLKRYYKAQKIIRR